MIKTSLITCGKHGNFQEKINEFIKDKKVIDIKYNSFPIYTSHDDRKGTVTGYVHDRALIMYEENKEASEESDIDPNGKCSTCEYDYTSSFEYPCNLCIVDGKITNNMYTPK